MILLPIKYKVILSMPLICKPYMQVRDNYFMLSIIKKIHS